MFAVRIAYHSIFSDFDTVGDDRAMNYRAFFHNSSRHQYAVINFRIGHNFRAGKQDGILYFSVDHASLGDKGAFDLCIWSDVVRRCGDIFGIDLPGIVAEIQRIVFVQKIHIASHRESMVPTSFQ